MLTLQIPRAKMETYNQSNTIAIYIELGHGCMDKAIPVPKREPRQSDEKQARNPEASILLVKNWKQVPPRNNEQHIKSVVHGNQEKLYYWCQHHHSWTIHSPWECRKQHAERKRAKRNTGKPRSTYRQPARARKNTDETESHSNPRHAQIEVRTRNGVHKPHQSNELKEGRCRYSNTSRR
jgi:hypothetical protein